MFKSEILPLKITWPKFTKLSHDAPFSCSTVYENSKLVFWFKIFFQIYLIHFYICVIVSGFTSTTAVFCQYKISGFYPTLSGCSGGVNYSVLKRLLAIDSWSGLMIGRESVNFSSVLCIECKIYLILWSLVWSVGLDRDCGRWHADAYMRLLFMTKFKSARTSLMYYKHASL